MKKVAIIIPCYNDGQYLKEAYRSALNQTYSNIEIVIVNDGSTDPLTLKVFQELEAEGAAVLHKENGHLSSARNHGIKHTRSDYIFPLDSDDWIDSDFIEKAVEILERDKSIGVVTSYIQTFGDRSDIGKPLGGGIKNVLIENSAACGNSLFRRICWEQAGGYDENMKNGMEDWDFWIRVLKQGWLVHVIPKPMFHYRITAKSMCLNMGDEYYKNLNYIVEKNRDVFAEHLEYVILEHERRFYDVFGKYMGQYKKLERLRKNAIYRILKKTGLFSVLRKLSRYF